LTTYLDTFSIAASHPALAGHFPDNPVVPGVVILDEVVNIVKKHAPEIEITGIAAVKFARPLLPEQVVTVQLQQKNGETIKFTCQHAEQNVVAGQFTVTTKAAR